MDFILLVAFHAALIVYLILSSKCLYNAMSYLQSFLYNIDNHFTFYLYPVKYRTVLLNI